MSLIKANAVQIGQSNTATQNFTLAVPSSPNGTIKLARGNAGATTQDVLNVSTTGVVSFPQGFATSSITANVTGNLTGDVFASNGTSKILENGTNGTDATFTGSVSGGTLSGNASSATALATGSTAARSLANRFGDVVNVKDFLCIDGLPVAGDGVHDDTTGIQAAIDTNSQVYFPKGKYRITSSLLIDPQRNRNIALIGMTTPSRYPYTQQPGGPTWDGLQESIIFYDGPIVSNTAVITISSELVGVEPPSTFAATIWSTQILNLTIDANSKAEYGIFTARAQNLILEKLNVRGGTIAGVSINGTYSGSIRSLRCYLNPGRGFELGAADQRYGWTTNDKVNAFYIYDIHADANGSDSTFRQTDPILRKNNCGVYFGPNRSVHIYGIVSENNFGANIVFEPSDRGNTINGIYTELGCKYAPTGAGSDAITLGYATQQLGIIFVGSSSGGSLGNQVSDGILASDYIWLTGTQPSSGRPENAFEIRNITLSDGLLSDWGNYRLVNCQDTLSTNITGTPPSGSFLMDGGIKFSTTQDALNYYDVGTFAPTIEGATIGGTGWGYSLQAGSYTRIGNKVFVEGRVTLSALSVDATGQIKIGSLPFPIPNINNNRSVANVIISTLTTSVVTTTGTAQVGSNGILLLIKTAASVSYSSLTLANLASTTSFDFSLTYTTT